MEETVRCRQEFIEETKAFLQTCQNTFSSLLQQLNWSPSNFVEQKEMGVCCYDSGHIMSKQDLKKHEPICKFTSRGVPKTEAMDESKRTSQFFYEKMNSVCNVPIDRDTLNKVLWEHHVEHHSIFYGKSEVPLTTEEECIMLTPSERGALHSYIRNTAKEQHKVQGLETDMLLTADFQEIVKKKALEGQNSKPTSYTEYLKAMRDYKRRRQSYRAKNVHITRKSYTEIIKEVIENQTEYLTEILKQDQEEEKQAKKVDTESEHTKDVQKNEEKKVDHRQKDCSHPSQNDGGENRSRETSHHRDRHRSRSRHRDRSSERDKERSRKRDREHKSKSRDRSKDKHKRKHKHKHKHKKSHH
ncbi:U11/U12 small nuclear ribonucleoprotein 48 kDa protein-like isoform X2 [Ostrea edulis]|nr:U11/U12 small nuclear ribonucleoprotein 48 kDa protein-like isoform X2 [Ostrea edulis]